MDLRPYVESIREQLIVAAAARGDDARALAEQLSAPLDAAVRLTLQDALAAAVEEITTELAPGSVELRLRGRDPQFVVNLLHDDAVETAWLVAPPPVAPDADDGGVSRINVRMPDSLKARVEDAAAREGMSVNGWLVRAAIMTLERHATERSRVRNAPRGSQHYTGWAR